ncbi:MAG: signal peptide peptidase SppA [Peptococcaceae bacterium]
MKINRANRKGFYIFCMLLVVCVGLAIYSTVGMGVMAGDNIAVLDIAGTISENDGYTYDQQYLLNSVDEIMMDSRNQGLLLRIDSPGGAVYQIDELYLKLMEYKEMTGRPIYAAIESYAASGGYYEACAADEIYANRNAITGSIGVIMGEFVDMSGLMDKLGVDVQYITSGPNKSMGNYYQALTEEQKAIYQSICDEYYDRFVEIVAQSRGMDQEKVYQLADGRVYSAGQALEHGLIDGLESFDDTLQRMMNDLGYYTMDVQYYSYSAPDGLLDILSSGNLFQQVSQLLGKNAEAETEQQRHVPMMYCQF